jgi:FkbM family methyltransferase
MKSEVQRLLTVSALSAAHLLQRAPDRLEWFTGFTRKYVDWRGSAVVCRTQFGARLSCNLKDLIQRKIAYFGVWEPHLTAYFKRALAPGDVFVDVGANIGYYTLLGAALVAPTGSVIAVEASPAIFATLSENLRRNRAGNVRAVNKAAAYCCGELPVFAASAGNIGRTSTVPVEGNNFESFVDAQPLHLILSRNELSRARLVKIDIEGAEGPVIQSVAENIGLYGAQCEFAVEVSPPCEWILGTMRGIGFHAYRVPNDYSDRDYLRQSPEPPVRYSGQVTAQCDFIFSRTDAEHL